MADPIHVLVGSRGISLTDTILVNGVNYNLTGASVKFYMRPQDSTSLTVSGSAAVVTDAVHGAVRYDWAANDVANPGVFFGWWTVTPAVGNPFDTPEFQIDIDAHAPGGEVLTGAIAQRVQEYIPILYAKLSTNGSYGDKLLQSRIDYAKFLLFSTVVNAAMEATVYNPILMDYTAKTAVVNIIPAGIDFWGDQPTSVSLSGTNETESFPNRTDLLWRIHERMLEELRRDRPIFEGACHQSGIQIALWKRGRFPKVVNEGPQITFAPSAMGPLFVTTAQLPETVETWR